MRAGSLDRTIIVERSTETPDQYGAVTLTWAALATLRAQLVQSTTAEFMRSYGASTERVFAFRTRWLDGITTQDRVTYDGAAFNIVELKELGRRKGLEIRCERIGT
ncbi:phage head closure protein [Ancylobacter sp. WKF20]|uniref:phage head closure protein n=1 Tax=Ancylobacter sp. WKF20 TaxID=3039801 RepID=UPI0024341AAF|nr:phage head closure protein [Ancylobacter sp. WKF20]WGD32010.1 phage head closure protein [Ancylobacter sp. WKF20]